MNFAIRLKTLREKRNLSQKQLAIELGVSFGTVGMWESAKRVPKAARLQEIANYFNVSTDYLLGSNSAGVSLFSSEGNEFSIEEIQFIEDLRKLTPGMREILRTTVRAMIEESEFN